MMREHSCRALLLALLIALPIVNSGAAAETGASATAASGPGLLDAAADGDLTRVRALLDAGTDVDSANRYGATALTFACDKGHTEVVRLLLERGADPNVTDTFYSQTPMGWAASHGHFDIAAMLIEHGATGGEADTLRSAAQAGSAVLAKALLSRWQPYGYQRDTAIQMARTGEHEEVVQILEAAEIRELPEVEIPRETLARYSGLYGGGELQVEVHLDPERGALVAEIPERGALALRPVSEEELRAEDDLSIGLRFLGRSGLIEAALLMQGASFNYLPRAETQAQAAAGAGPTPGTSEETQEEETKTRPAEKAAGQGAAAAAKHPRAPSPHWPGFRGLGAAGIGSGTPPVTWDVAEGAHVRWKTEIPGLGHSSPVVWGDRVVLTTAISAAGNHEIRTGLTGDVATIEDDSEHTWKVLALDRNSGEILWERVAGKAVPASSRHFKATQANSTPVTDGEHLVVVFPTLGIFCYDLAGELKWHHTLGALDAGWFYDPSYGWGFSSSPVLFEDLVIVQADVQEGGFVAAWRLADGKQVWRTERDDVPGFSTPTVFVTGKGAELVTNGSTIRGYDPRTGRELWSLGPNSELPIATPVVVPGRGERSDLVIVTAGYPPVRPIYAIRAGARGDISPADGPGNAPGSGPGGGSIAWSHDRGGAYMPTPLVYGDLFYLVHHNARLVAYDPATGEEVYKARFSEGGTFTGSPVAADGRIYFPTEEGRVYVVQAGPEYQELAINDMGEVVMTTPAISEGTLFVRSLRHLWALEQPRADGKGGDSPSSTAGSR